MTHFLVSLGLVTATMIAAVSFFLAVTDQTWRDFWAKL